MSRAAKAAVVMSSMALAVSVAALVLALTALTPADVQNGSVGASDLAPSLKEQLRGPPGAQGPRGFIGATGGEGPSGPAGAPGFDGADGQDYGFEVEELDSRLSGVESRVDGLCSAELASRLRQQIFSSGLTWYRFSC